MKELLFVDDKGYQESLNVTGQPIMLSQIPQMNLDLRGLMKYAANLGKKVTELTDEEKKYLYRISFPSFMCSLAGCMGFVSIRNK